MVSGNEAKNSASAMVDLAWRSPDLVATYLGNKKRGRIRMLKLYWLTIGVIGLSLLSACATVTSGTDHTLLVESDPAGATCT